MTLFNKQPTANQLMYINSIKNIASFSRLFTTESAAPYLVSRATENIFCEALHATNLGRDDSAIDAILSGYGVGIKTFLHNNGRTLQKIAEFNRNSGAYRELSDKEKVYYIARLRNERLQFALNNYGVKELIYHCITRKNDGTINFYETPMDFIDIRNINSIVSKQNSISFNDKINEYNFNLTKSTLFKRFPFSDDRYLVASINVDIIQDPFIALSNIERYSSKVNTQRTLEKEYVILPLYSFSNSTGKIVPEKSGLNQWNAGGRKRNISEAYIPISRKIHQAFPNFFPERDVSFSLKLPNSKLLSVKVCQDNDKALMSNPNKALGEWILRDVLKLDEKQLLTYEKLAEIGVDSVIITKIDEANYTIDFCEIGSYDEFSTEHEIG